MNIKKLQSALGRKFSFSIANASGSDTVVYILNAFFDCVDYDVTQAGADPFAVSDIDPKFTEILPLTNYGLPTGMVLDDGTIGTSVTGTAGVSDKKIRQWKQQIRYFPQACNKITIASDNVEQFDESIYVGSIDLMLKSTSEFGLNVSEYLDRYQNITTKVDIPFSNVDPLVLDASIYMYTTIRAGRTVTFTFNFN